MMSIKDVSPRMRFRLSLRAVFLVIGIASGFVASILIRQGHYYWAILPASAVLLAAGAEFVLADILTESQYPAQTTAILEKLEVNLRDYHDSIMNSIGSGIHSLQGCDRSKVSGTFHLKVNLYSPSAGEEEPALVQVTDYSGQLGGKRWRFTIGSKGLIGRCLRTEKAECVNFATEAEYDERMIREYGFSRAEVAKHTKEARSYWAQPVFQKGNMIGVIFLFSTEVQVFPVAADAARLEERAREISACLAGAGVV